MGWICDALPKKSYRRMGYCRIDVVLLRRERGG
jgi:hypothetical protein